MIKFKLIEGLEGYEFCKDFRKEMFENDILEEIDKNAIHMYGTENGEVICCARLHKIGDYVFTIDKVAVIPKDRKQYVGDTMIRALEDKAVSLIGALISVNVPENAWEFFEHEEYVPVGDIFVDNGVKYKKMKRDLTKIRGCRGGCHK